jgi:hypothetical protein
VLKVIAAAFLSSEKKFNVNELTGAPAPVSSLI